MTPADSELATSEDMEFSQSGYAIYDTPQSDPDAEYDRLIEFVYGDDGDAKAWRTLENGDERSITVVQVNTVGFDGPYIMFIPSVRLPFPNSYDIDTAYTTHAIRVPDASAIPETFVDTFGVMDNRVIFLENQRLHSKIEDFILDVTGVASMEYQGSLDLAAERCAADIKESILRRAFDCSVQICREIIPGDLPERHDATREGLGIRIVYSHDDLMVATNDNTDKPITLGDLSSGTQILMWIWHVAMKLHNHFMEIVKDWLEETSSYHNNGTFLLEFALFKDGRFTSQDTNNFHLILKSTNCDVNEVFPILSPNSTYHYLNEWWKLPFILVIDEIENHLHPTWQRRVIPALLEYFPNVQIIATTHSPFVVAGLKAGQVHLLNRDENGVVSTTTNTEDIEGWTADEILRALMGVEDPTDDATAEAARELRQLRDAGPRPDERAEEQRQARMQELRERVNRDVLAGSARAAEEERFAENLTRILERYRLSQDLNQENG